MCPTQGLRSLANPPTKFVVNLCKYSRAWLLTSRKGQYSYFVSLQKIAVQTEAYDVMVNSEELHWYHKVSDAIDEVSHKAVSF